MIRDIEEGGSGEKKRTFIHMLMDKIIRGESVYPKDAELDEEVMEDCSNDKVDAIKASYFGLVNDPKAHKKYMKIGACSIYIMLLNFRMRAIIPFKQIISLKSDEEKGPLASAVCDVLAKEKKVCSDIYGCKLNSVLHPLSSLSETMRDFSTADIDSPKGLDDPERALMNMTSMTEFFTAGMLDWKQTKKYLIKSEEITDEMIFYFILRNCEGTKEEDMDEYIANYWLCHLEDLPIKIFSVLNNEEKFQEFSSYVSEMRECVTKMTKGGNWFGI